jgi:hypothetical protein
MISGVILLTCNVKGHAQLQATLCIPQTHSLCLTGVMQSGVGQAFSGDEYRAAEPDALRKFAVELISVWNSDRAEDIYRIVSAHMGVPLVEVCTSGGRKAAR